MFYYGNKTCDIHTTSFYSILQNIQTESEMNKHEFKDIKWIKER